MAEVRPFRGVLYDTVKAGADFERFCAPPYDVISKEMREELYEKSEHNVIRLILGKESGTDTDSDNKYTRARDFLNEWIKKGIFVKEEKEAFYVYLQEYEVKGKKYRRVGFLGAMKIVEPEEKVIFPHEHTLAAPKEDRMNLIKQVKSNLSPIFSLFPDDKGTVSRIIEKIVSGSKARIDSIVDGERNALWVVTDTTDIETISNVMKDSRIFIADGHHRYEVARKYRNYMREQKAYDGSADHIMMYFAPMSKNNDLTIMATHRVIKENAPLGDDLVAAKVGKSFEVHKFNTLSDLMKAMDVKTDKHAFGFYGGDKYIFMELKDAIDPVQLVKEDRSSEWKKLDVSILHYSIFKDLLNVKSQEGNVTYVRDAEEADALVKNKSHVAAFFLNPTKVSELKAVAESGDMMPQKSTYFYPKLLTGLVINKLEK